MDDIEFLCPHCEQSLSAPSEMQGETVKCPTCGQSLAIPQAENVTETPSSSSPSGTQEANTMSSPKMKIDMAKLKTAIEEGKTGAKPPKKSPTVKIAAIAVATIAVLALSTVIVSVIARRGNNKKAKVAAYAKNSETRFSDRNRNCEVESIERSKNNAIAGLTLPLSEMAKSFSRGIPCKVLGQVLVFPERNTKVLIGGQYSIPLEKQSKRISFDFRSTGETATGRGHTSVKVFTWGDADLFGIIIPNDGTNLRVWCRRGVERTFGSKAEVSTTNKVRKGMWIHVDIRMNEEQTDVTVAGETVHLPPLNGGRIATIDVSVGKPNLELRNITSYPSKSHYNVATEYLQALNESEGHANRLKVGAVRKAAEGGLDEAQLMYALASEARFPNYNLSNEEILHWYLEAARQGNVQAQFMAGKQFMGDNDVMALSWFKRAAESGFHKAELYYGFLLIPHDQAEAKQWIDFANMAYDIDPNIFDDKEKDLLFTALRILNKYNQRGTRF